MIRLAGSGLHLGYLAALLTAHRRAEGPAFIGT
jgi:hypothetical protein